ncbi:MAG: GDP-mannose 4,6-dehydratase, partial [Bacteroidia bacterium]
DKAEDFVIATGQTTTVRDFVRMSFAELGIILRFEGEGVEEKGIVDYIDRNKLMLLNIDVCPLREGDVVVCVDERYFRPTEVDLLIGDPTKAQQKLGWKPEYDLQALVSEMMISDLDLMKKEKFLKESGFTTLNYFE